MPTDDRIRPISHQSTNDKVLGLVVPLLRPGLRVLDLGAGEGYFSQVLGEQVRVTLRVDPATVVQACDVTPDLFRYQGTRCDAIGDDGRLPYSDGTFDVVCSLEVVEHVEDQFAFCREILRVLRPGGVAVVSTPNVLNLNSRWRNLTVGFATLFNPLSTSAVDVVHTSGHIHPIGYYYLAFALHRAGARDISAEFDRIKRSAAGLLALTWPLLLIGSFFFTRKLARKQPAVLRENASWLATIQSLPMLLSRSVLVVARKPLA